VASFYQAVPNSSQHCTVNETKNDVWNIAANVTEHQTGTKPG